ncbi:unnamed protein product [Mytilus coruscus]|uniref:Mab-21-like HhH/H2TH-like domain-containing protein n=1 Tax=Mytilus coruscus TaxID=42192 RepID=A0A6J7ZZL5_MYTCO|nr:unnamed protein product [Mytilus coruscus]
MTAQFTKRISKLPNNYTIWKYYTCPIEEFRGLLEIRFTKKQYFNSFKITSGNCLNKLEPDVERKLKSLSESEENPSDASLDLETDTCTGEDDVDADNGREANLNLQLGKISDDYNQQGFTDQLKQTDLDEIWKNSRVSRRIKQHRAGSRVESQTRILPPGKDTDVDYMFELDGILVNCGDECKDIYWKHSSDSPAFGAVYVDEKYRKQLEQNHSDIFTADTFEWKPDENAFLLLPSKFKENVVNASHFEFSRDKSVSVASPSISGKGAVNEYDTVPCLRLSKWPKLAESWISRGPYSKRYTFSSKWKESLVNVVPLFLVPTGNPLSRNKHEQFRLSFSMVEIKCFNQLTAKMRTNYGISKYAFKRLFCSESCDILSSYHIKTIFLWIVEELRINDWKRISPINFVRTVFSEMKSCILKQSVRHFFVNGCNIFPSHKISDDNISFYNKNFERDTKMISQAVTDLLRSDLDISSDSGNMLNVARSKLRLLASQERIESYIGGYLTRLLSMTTFSLFENELQGTLTESIDNIRTVFSSYQTDKHLKKIINAINIFIVSVQTRNTVIIKLIPSHLNRFDNLTEIAHAAFEFSEGYQFRPGEIGVSITKYHKEYELDTPIHFVICELEKRYNGTCPRFYIDPYLMIKHLQFQIKLKTNSEFRNSETLPTLQKQLLEMEDITKQLSERVPYIGKLSYKFAAVYLIHGYRKQFKELGTNLSLTIPENINLDSFNQRMFAKNFDLR